MDNHLQKAIDLNNRIKDAVKSGASTTVNSMTDGLLSAGKGLTNVVKSVASSNPFTSVGVGPVSRTPVDIVEHVKERLNRFKKSDTENIQTANILESSINQDVRPSPTPTTAVMWTTDKKIPPNEYQVTPQYHEPLTLDRMRDKTNPIRTDATLYNPDDKGQTSKTSDGKTPKGKILDWGDVAINNRAIPRGTKIFVPELNETFTNNDRMNGGWDIPGYNRIDFAIRRDNPRKTELEERIRTNPELTFYIVE